MWSLVWSPIPLIINFVLFLVFSTPPISALKWAKVSRILIICLFFTQILFMYSGLVDKAEDGRLRSEAYRVVTFTTHVNQLISEERYSKATEILVKFNDMYPQLQRAGNNLESREFIKNLINDSK